MSKTFELLKQSYYKLLKDKTNKLILEQLFLAIEKAEQELLQRDYIKFCLYTRIATEVAEDLIIFNASLFAIKVLKNKETNKQFIELNKLEVSLPHVANRLRSIRYNSSNYLHWDIDVKKITKKSTKIFSEVPTLDKSIDWLKELTIALNKLLNLFQVNSDVSISNPIEFEDIYSQSKQCVKNAPHELMSFTGKACLICKEIDKNSDFGRLQLKEYSNQDKKWFEYGVFLTCDKCDAILSTGLNLRRKKDHKIIDLKK